jgi:hypothetical protein
MTPSLAFHLLPKEAMHIEVKAVEEKVRLLP